jgi:ankyrin repeat protein
MSRNDEELRKQLAQYDDEPDLVVNRQSQSNTSILPIIILFVGLYFVFNYYSENKQTVQGLTETVKSKLAATEKIVPKTLSNNDVKLHQTIANGKVEQVKQALLTDKKAINDVVNGMTPIMLAASRGNVEIIDLLFTQGADPNKRGSMQRTALQYAVEKNRIEAAERLLAYGADIDAYDNGRLTPLIMAANRGYTELGLLFIEKGADVNIQHSAGWTALIDATAKNDVKLVEALLRVGADKDLKANNGLKAIDYARQYGFKNLEKILIK